MKLTKELKWVWTLYQLLQKKFGDENFKNDLLFQYDKYNEILNKVNTELKNYNDFPAELPPMQKVMGYVDIQVSTLNDKSNSHIAEMLIKGTNLGIIEGVKLKNHNPNTDVKIQNILDEFIKFQENNVEKLKKYL